jgi:AraC-like DNA-binding protein
MRFSRWNRNIARQPAKGRLHLSSKELAQIIELVDRLEAELKAREPGFGFMATAAFMQIIGLLSRCYGRSPSPDGKALLRIGEALSHLERNIQNEVNLEELASIAHMSRRSFLRVFQSATGTSPLAWLIDQRIHRACSLLRNTDKQITEIAFDVGFNDSNYFTRQFRKATGLSRPRIPPAAGLGLQLTSRPSAALAAFGEDTLGFDLLGIHQRRRV